MLNGADGLGEIAAGLVAQGLTIFDAIKRDLTRDRDPRGADGDLTGRDGAGRDGDGLAAPAQITAPE